MSCPIDRARFLRCSAFAALAVRRAGQSLVVDAGTVFQQDSAHDAWSRAVVTVG